MLLKDLKLSSRFIDESIMLAQPQKMYAYNKSNDINMDWQKKKIVISNHALQRLKERFFIQTSKKQLAKYIKEYSGLLIKTIFNRKKVVEKFYEATLKIGQLPAKLFFVKSLKGYFILSTLYPNIEDQSFTTRMLELHNKPIDPKVKNNIGKQKNESNLLKSRKNLITRKKIDSYKGPTFKDIFDNIKEYLDTDIRN